MILITGAGGKTGQAVLSALSRQDEKTRALLRDGSRRGAVLAAGAAGAAEAATGSFTNLEDLCAAMQDVRSVYHICPNMHPNEIDIGRLVLQAARMSGVEQIVYHSVLHPQVEAMPHHWKKMRVEELIFQSGLEFTILQPCAYMQNILGYWNAIRRDGVYALPYASTAEISVVDLEDVAQAAALVLTETGHAGATYELCGPEALSADVMAVQIAGVLGRPVSARSLDRAAWAERVRAGGMADYEADTLLKMFEYYEKYNFRGSARTLECLIERKPRKFADYIQQLSSGDHANG